MEEERNKSKYFTSLSDRLDMKADEINMLLLCHSDTTETQLQLIRKILGILFENVTSTD